MMNERIKSLVEQAGIKLIKPTGFVTAIGSQAQSRQIEKLVELIVRDAADMFEVEYGSSEGLSGNRIAAVLKEHFGVEE